MPQSLLDKIQSDPDFSGLTQKGKREFLREVLGRDPDYRSLSTQGQAEFANEIYRRYPDVTAQPPTVAQPQASVPVASGASLSFSGEEPGSYLKTPAPFSVKPKAKPKPAASGGLTLTPPPTDVERLTAQTAIKGTERPSFKTRMQYQFEQAGITPQEARQKGIPAAIAAKQQREADANARSEDARIKAQAKRISQAGQLGVGGLPPTAGQQKAQQAYNQAAAQIRAAEAAKGSFWNQIQPFYDQALGEQRGVYRGFADVANAGLQPENIALMLALPVLGEKLLGRSALDILGKTLFAQGAVGVGQSAADVETLERDPGEYFGRLAANALMMAPDVFARVKSGQLKRATQPPPRKGGGKETNILAGMERDPGLRALAGEKPLGRVTADQQQVPQPKGAKGNALFQRIAEEEVSPVGVSGQNLPESRGGVRPGEQGQEIAGARQAVPLGPETPGQKVQPAQAQEVAPPTTRHQPPATIPTGENWLTELQRRNAERNAAQAAQAAEKQPVPAPTKPAPKATPLPAAVAPVEPKRQYQIGGELTDTLPITTKKTPTGAKVSARADYEVTLQRKETAAGKGWELRISEPDAQGRPISRTIGKVGTYQEAVRAAKEHLSEKYAFRPQEPERALTDDNLNRAVENYRLRKQDYAPGSMAVSDAAASVARIAEKIGAPIPPEVLADYPDLAAKYGQKPTPPTPEPAATAASADPSKIQQVGQYLDAKAEEALQRHAQKRKEQGGLNTNFSADDVANAVEYLSYKLLRGGVKVAEIGEHLVKMFGESVTPYIRMIQAQAMDALRSRVTPEARYLSQKLGADPNLFSKEDLAPFLERAKEGKLPTTAIMYDPTTIGMYHNPDTGAQTPTYGGPGFGLDTARYGRVAGANTFGDSKPDEAILRAARQTGGLVFTYKSSPETVLGSHGGLAAAAEIRAAIQSGRATPAEILDLANYALTKKKEVRVSRTTPFASFAELMAVLDDPARWAFTPRQHFVQAMFRNDQPYLPHWKRLMELLTDARFDEHQTGDIMSALYIDPAQEKGAIAEGLGVPEHPVYPANLEGIALGLVPGQGTIKEFAPEIWDAQRRMLREEYRKAGRDPESVPESAVYPRYKRTFEFQRGGLADVPTDIIERLTAPADAGKNAPEGLGVSGPGAAAGNDTAISEGGGAGAGPSGRPVRGGGPGGNLRGRLNAEADAARARLSRPDSLASGVKPEHIRDLAYIAADNIVKGVDWSAELIRHFGEAVRPHLQEIERQARALVERYGKTKRGFPELSRDVQALSEAAQDQESWKTWYTRHETVLRQIFGEDADLFQKMLSATSQAASVKANTGLALKALQQYKRGEPFTGYLPQVIGNLERIRNEEALSGGKISQYGKANEGDVDAVAVDRHIAEMLFDTPKPSPAQLEMGKATVRSIAQKLGWEGRQVQAALWAFNQVRKGVDPTKVESYDKILEKRADEIAKLRADLDRGSGGGAPVGGATDTGTSGAQASAPNLRQRLDTAEANASQKLQKKLSKKGLTAGVDPSDFPLLAELGAIKLARKALNFADFSRELLTEAGQVGADYAESLKPHLQKLYEDAKTIHTAKYLPMVQQQQNQPQEREAIASGDTENAQIPEGRVISPVENVDLERMAKQARTEADLSRILEDSEGTAWENRVAEAVARNPFASEATFQRAIRKVRQNELLDESYIEKYIVGPRNKQHAAPEQPVPPTEPRTRPAQPAVSDFSRARMADIEAAAAEHGFTLPDRAEYRESIADVKQRALANYDTIAQSLDHYDPDRNALLTDEEKIVAHARVGELSRKLREAKTEAETTALLTEIERVSGILHRAGSASGRSLRIQADLIADPTDPAAVMQQLDRHTDGKASPLVRRSLLQAAEKAQAAQQQAEAAIERTAAQNEPIAAQTIRTRTNKSAQGTPRFQSSDWGSQNEGVTRADAERARNALNKALFKPGAFPDFADALPHLVTLAKFHFEAGARKFSEWRQAMQSDAGGLLDEGELETVWASMRADRQAEQQANRQTRAIPAPESFTDRLAGKIGREGAVNFLDAISDDDGNPAILNKMLRGEALTSAEKKTVQDAWEANAPSRKTTTGAKPAPDTALSTILKETAAERARMRPPTVASVEKRTAQTKATAEKVLSTLGQNRPKPPAPTRPEVLVAAQEYAKGARSLDSFAKSIQKKYGDMDPAFTERLFAEAAAQYRTQTKDVDTIKEKMNRDIAREAYRLSPAWKKALVTTGRIADIPRSLLTSFDYSGLLRQGGTLSLSSPTSGASAAREMFKAGAREENAQAADFHLRNIRANGANGNYEKAGLELTDLASKHEEGFGSPLAEAIPVLGRGVKGSERAYSTVLNQLRADAFDRMTGAIPGADETAMQDIARYINVASGRGDIQSPKARQIVSAAANVLFSPRYLASRFQYLAGQPLWSAKSPAARKVIAGEYARYLRGVGTFLAVGAALMKQNGQQMETDPRSSDFLKIRLGDTEIDALSGLQQVMTYSARMLSQQTKTSTGEIKNLREPETELSPTTKDVNERFLRSKLGPVPGMVWNLAEAKRLPKVNPKNPDEKPDYAKFGTDYLGKPQTPGGILAGLTLPFGVQDMIRAWQDGGMSAKEAKNLAAAFGLATFGLGANVRDRAQEAKERLEKHPPKTEAQQRKAEIEKRIRDARARARFQASPEGRKLREQERAE